MLLTHSSLVFVLTPSEEIRRIWICTCCVECMSFPFYILNLQPSAGGLTFHSASMGKSQQLWWLHWLLVWKTLRRGGSLCTLNLIAAWFDTALPSAVSFYPIEANFKEIKRCIHTSLWLCCGLICIYSHESKRGRKRPLKCPHFVICVVPGNRKWTFLWGWQLCEKKY